jgi:ribulose-5-phosphate 4-epimerase/fuculose-1-phosphate aldolase
MAAIIQALTNTDAEQEEWRLRCDMAAVFRASARYGWNEQIGNHNSLMLPQTRPDDPPLFLINPRGYLFQELTASSLIVCDLDGNVIRGKGELRKVAFHIHARIHLLNPGATCVLHVHPQYLTALSMLDDPQFHMAHGNNLFLNDRVVMDNWGGQPVHDNEEGDRIAGLLGDKTIMVMGGHGVTVVGPTVEDAFDDLYSAERTCMYLMTAQATGQKLRQLPEKHRVGYTGPRSARADCRMFLDAWRRILDKEEPDYTS